MGRTLRLITDASLQSLIPDLLSEWEMDRVDEGWNVLPRLVSPTDPNTLKSLIASNPSDHIFLAGNDIPYIMVSANPDGHGSRPLPMDGMFGTQYAIGRLSFKLQSDINNYYHVYSEQMYREYFQRRHAWSVGAWTQYNAGICALVDNFASQYPYIGDSYRKSIPPDIYVYENLDPSFPVDGAIWTKWQTTAPMVAITSSGGMSPGWLWNCGHTYDWFSKSPKVPIAFFFGSYMLEVHQDNNIMMGAMASTHTLCTFSPYLFTSGAGAYFAGLFDGTKTVGDIGRGFWLSSASKYCYVGGDPTMALPTIYQLSQTVADHERRITVLEAGTPTPTPPSIPTGVTATTGSTSVTLSWNTVSGATSYNVKRSTSPGGPYTQIAQPPSVGYTDTGLTNGTKYYYVITAVNSVGESGNSTEVSATPVQSASTHATYVGSDTTSKGNWKGVYGAEGFDIIGDVTQNPVYCNPSYSGQSLWNWQTGSGVDPNAHPECLQKASGTGRIAVCYYTMSSMSIDINIPLGTDHKVTLYLVDLLAVGRVEEIKVQDFVTGTVFDTRTISNFAMGVYHTWQASGHVRIILTFKSSPGPQTAVMSGLFFDAS